MRIVYVILLAVALACGGGPGADPGLLEVSEAYRMEPECRGAIDQQLWAESDPPSYACYWTCVAYKGEPYQWITLTWRLGHWGWENASAWGFKGECH